MSNPEIPQIRAMLRQIPANLPPVEMRALYDSLGGQFPLAPDVTVCAETIRDIPAEWTSTPGAGPEKGAVLYIHGGGYITGSIVSHRHLVAELGRAAGARALAINYRLAPEHKFPSAIDDCLAAYRFLLDSGCAPTKISIAGDSAGGGLVIATLLAARKAGVPQPACAVCISPWLDLEVLGETMASKASEDPLVQREALLHLASNYLGGASARDPLASPLHADLRGLAPLLIQVGSAEVLLDDAVRFVARAGAQEVEVRLDVWPEMIHVWPFFHPILDAGRRALVAAGAFIRSHVESPA